MGLVFTTWAFERNAGQVYDENGNIRKDVLYTKVFNDYSVILHKKGFSYQFHSPKESDDNTNSNQNFTYHRVDIEFVHVNETFSVVEGSLKHRNSYFLSDGIRYTTEIWEEVTFENVVNGVDIRFSSKGNVFKYDIICQDEASLKRFKLKYNGILNSLQSTESGSVVFETAMGKIEERVPESFFQSSNGKMPTKVRTEITESGKEVQFKTESVWPSGTSLVIDPFPDRMWSTYIGGGERDELNRIEVDSNGDAFVSGFTSSLNNIATSGAYQGIIAGFQNTFIAKYDSNGNKIWGTYFGGNTSDRSYALCLDEERSCIYVGGSTLSDGLSTSGVHQESLASTDDAFLAKFDLQGQLQWCTYYGGNEHDFIADIDVDALGYPVVTGHTRSSTGIATDLTFLPGFENAFIAKFTNGGIRLWGTYFGGTMDDGWGIKVDSDDNIYVCGTSSSTTEISSMGAYQEQNAGGFDAFLVKYTSWGEKIWGTYLGGAGDESANDLAIMPDGSIAIVGDTESPSGMSTIGSFQEQPSSTEDGFLSSFSPDGSLNWSTYIGGSGIEYLHRVVVASNGDLLIVGQSESVNNIAEQSAFQSQPNGEYDGIVVSFNQAGEYLWGTYLGGESLDILYDVGEDPETGHIVVGGLTRSQTEITSSNASQITFSGGLNDSFLARLCYPATYNISPMDGLLLCGPGDLSFNLDPSPISATWHNGYEGLILTLGSENSGVQNVFAEIIDSTGCPSFSDTIVVSLNPTFNPEIPVSVFPGLTACLGTTYELSIESEFEDVLWWDNSSSATTTFTPVDTIAYELSVSATDVNGCTASGSVTVQSNLCVGEAELKGKNHHQLYPNPSCGTVFYRAGSSNSLPVRIQIFSIDGKQVFDEEILISKQISLPLSSGLYQVQITNTEGRIEIFKHVLR